MLGGFPLYNTLDGIVSNIDGSTWADFKGKKIRVSAPDSKRVFELCGTSSVYMPLGETYQGLKTGVIDGVDTSPRSVIERSLNEVAKYLCQRGPPWNGFVGQRVLCKQAALGGSCQPISKKFYRTVRQMPSGKEPANRATRAPRRSTWIRCRVPE